MNKQISLTVPQALFKASKEYSVELGYRSIQEFILDLVRKRVFLDEEERLLKIEKEMDNDPNVKTFKTKKEALKYLDDL